MGQSTVESLNIELLLKLRAFVVVRKLSESS